MQIGKVMQDQKESFYPISGSSTTNGEFAELFQILLTNNAILDVEFAEEISQFSNAKTWQPSKSKQSNIQSKDAPFEQLINTIMLIDKGIGEKPQNIQEQLGDTNVRGNAVQVNDKDISHLGEITQQSVVEHIDMQDLINMDESVNLTRYTDDSSVLSQSLKDTYKGQELMGAVVNATNMVAQNPILQQQVLSAWDVNLSNEEVEQLTAVTQGSNETEPQIQKINNVNDLGKATDKQQFLNNWEFFDNYQEIPKDDSKQGVNLKESLQASEGKLQAQTTKQQVLLAWDVNLSNEEVEQITAVTQGSNETEPQIQKINNVNDLGKATDKQQFLNNWESFDNYQEIPKDDLKQGVNLKESLQASEGKLQAQTTKQQVLLAWDVNLSNEEVEQITAVTQGSNETEPQIQKINNINDLGKATDKQQFLNNWKAFDNSQEIPKYDLKQGVNLKENLQVSEGKLQAQTVKLQEVPVKDVAIPVKVVDSHAVVEQGYPTDTVGIEKSKFQHANQSDKLKEFDIKLSGDTIQQNQPARDGKTGSIADSTPVPILEQVASGMQKEKDSEKYVSLRRIIQPDAEALNPGRIIPAVTQPKVIDINDVGKIPYYRAGNELGLQGDTLHSRATTNDQSQVPDEVRGVILPSSQRIPLTGEGSQYPQASSGANQHSDSIGQKDQLFRDVDLQINQEIKPSNPIKPEHTNNQVVSREVPIQHMPARLSEMVREMVLRQNPGQTTLRMKLQPEHIGEVTVKLTWSKGELSAQFIASSGLAKEALESSFPQLKEMLAQQNIRLSEAAVFMGQQSGQWERDSSDSRQPWQSKSQTKAKHSYANNEVTPVELGSSTGKTAGNTGVNIVV